MRTTTLFVGTLLYYQSHQLFRMLVAIYLTSWATLLYTFYLFVLAQVGSFYLLFFLLQAVFIIFRLINSYAMINNHGK